MLDAEGFPDAVISASNDLDEGLISSLKNQGATINSWGVGTNLITSKDCPSFGGVYKLAAIKDKATGKFIPKIKLSENEEKITNPGNKTIYRIYSLAPGTYTMKEIMVPVFKDGTCVYRSPKVMEIREYCKKELDTLWDETKRLMNPHEVHVDLSNELWHMKTRLLDAYHFE